MNHRRIGKIARLPAQTREQVNEMLYDGLEYSRIIDWLTQQGHSGVSPKNITNWKEGGYEDWLNHCQRLDELELKSEYAVEVAQQADPSKFQHATVNLTCLQFFEMLNRFDPVRLAASLQVKPEKYPALINALARFTREYVGLKRFHEELSDKAKAEAAKNCVNDAGLDAEGVARILRALRIRYPREFALEGRVTTSPTDQPTLLPLEGRVTTNPTHQPTPLSLEGRVTTSPTNDGPPTPDPIDLNGGDCR